MNKNLLIVIALFACSINVKSQQDTNLYQTATSANVATWLKNFSIASGTGHISILNPKMGSMIMSVNGRNYVDNNDMSAYYQNTSLYQGDLIQAGTFMRRDFRKMQQVGAFMARSPALIAWGAVEPTQGTYYYSFIDSTVKIAGEYGVKLVGTVLPFADWAQSCNSVNSNCNLYTGAADYFFLNDNKNRVNMCGRYKLFLSVC